MSEAYLLETLQSFYGDLIAIGEGRLHGPSLEGDELTALLANFKNFLEEPPKREASRKQLESGKINVGDVEYSVNKEFQEYSIQLADEVNLDEVEAAKLLLEAQDSQILLGRSLVECALIRFHQRRKYLLDCIRLCIELANDDENESIKAVFEEIVARYVFDLPLPGAPAAAVPKEKKIVPRCMAAMAKIKDWLEKLANKIMLARMHSGTAPPEIETIEFCRLSLVQQHENLAVILCAAVEQRHAERTNFEEFIQLLKKADKYDHLLVHLFPVIGAYIRLYGSTEGWGDLVVARSLNQKIVNDETSWSLPFLYAAVKVWWIAEYSGFYVEGPVSDPSIDIDKEDKERNKQFTDALKEGAFDFMLSLAGDVAAPEWQDPSRIGIRQWLQRKSPQLMTDATPFSDYFHTCLMNQLEDFVDAFISNLPDVLRKLRTEEDEQRQLSQHHEQDLDLERFLVIISYVFERRPDAADVFWSDSESNLAGFMQWASRRASTPLVCAFCEMLQSITENEQYALAAHQFLLEDSNAGGKMRRSQSLTWAQIFKELHYFTKKIRGEISSPQQTHEYRTQKPGEDLAETEPESAMLLECYLRLIARLGSQSTAAREFLLRNQDFPLVDVILQLNSCHIPPRLRACGFYAIAALMRHKEQEDSNTMWACIDAFVSGGFQAASNSRALIKGQSHSSAGVVDRVLDELSNGFEEPNAFINLINALVAPADQASLLRDALPFPENLGSSLRMPGIEPYVDFVLGHVFSLKSKELQDISQLRVLRVSCLEFILLCLNTFNEDLIILGNETNVSVDSIISASDLATYVRLHPFARVMEWMFNGQVVDAIFQTIHQQSSDIGSVSPDSPLILGIIRAVEVVSKVLELQDTYVDLVRQVIKQHTGQRHRHVPHASYASFEEGFAHHLEVVADLGRYCGLGHPELTMVCLKLLARISTSSKLISAWNTEPGRQSHRNKAVVALEKDGEADSISGSLIAELIVPLDLAREADSPNYLIKTYILDFLYACLRASPDKPTIAHLLLGFKCGVSHLKVEPRGQFEERTSLFHNLLRVLLETPFGDEELGMRTWLVSLKRKVMGILQILWSSPLSSAIVLEELRSNDVLFHILLREESIQPDLVWDGVSMEERGFLLSDAAVGFSEFLATRQLTFDYLAIELCSVTQRRLPSLKRRIYDALNGQVTTANSDSPQPIPTIFDLYDFMPADGQWEIPTPEFTYFRGEEFNICLEGGHDSVPLYNMERVKQVIELKRRQDAHAGHLATATDLASVDREQVLLEEYLVYHNRQAVVNSERRKVLKAWVNLLMVMFEASDHQGSAKVAFLLQALQTILPSLESFGSERPGEAFELAKLAKVLLFKLDIAAPDAGDKDAHTVGNLISEKLFQLFEVCLYAIGRRTGSAELRSTYYAICYRYLTGIIDDGRDFVPGRRKAIKAVQVYGERLLTIVCDDAFGGDATCQTSALILLGALTNLGRRENDGQVVEALNRLNFIGVLVDSLKTILDDVNAARKAGNSEQQEAYSHAKLALLLQLCQTRDGAKYVLQANLLRAIELSGLFAADPELQIDRSDTKALADHYDLLIRVMRVIGAAILSRGAHNVPQGRRFLTEHRMLVMHVLKRSAGIAAVDQKLEELVVGLADSFMVLITATEFLEFEDTQGPGPQQQKRNGPVLFH
ncbi:hypothetical protein PpBr36_00589 [Pyricularia pennisetigena]|uniref:hypothetical protein n=1 Tax=Pyricularia pennisetigena TaxID=1578925 RepID=UPI00114E4969|nr:hypothetical protein PpBr36_00589 [Pyricularia pennisetigena]TLS28723.1 hypothetical protein PpBr36_00589 [Pyricularia pennisetigena]